MKKENDLLNDLSTDIVKLLKSYKDLNYIEEQIIMSLYKAYKAGQASWWETLNEDQEYINNVLYK